MPAEEFENGILPVQHLEQAKCRFQTLRLAW